MTQLSYVELQRDMVSRRIVEDINHLLPQLSSSAPKCTPEWLDYVLASGTKIFAAFDGDKLVGTVLLSPMVILVGQKDWIEDVVVDEDYRRMGIASKLMDMAEYVSHSRNANSINLTSSPDRGPARFMYEARGYVLRLTGVFRKAFRH